MNQQEAREVTDFLFGTNGVRQSKIDAIKHLRNTAILGLKEAKDWVDNHERMGEVGFYDALLQEFCNISLQDQLAILLEQQRVLDLKIQDIVAKIEFEKTR